MSCNICLICYSQLASLNSQESLPTQQLQNPMWTLHTRHPQNPMQTLLIRRPQNTTQALLMLSPPSTMRAPFTRSTLIRTNTRFSQRTLNTHRSTQPQMRQSNSGQHKWPLKFLTKMIAWVVGPMVLWMSQQLAA